MAISNCVPKRPGDLVLADVDRQVTVVQFLVQLVRRMRLSESISIHPCCPFRFVNDYCMYLGLDNGPPQHKGLNFLLESILDNATQFFA